MWRFAIPFAVLVLAIAGCATTLPSKTTGESVRSPVAHSPAVPTSTPCPGVSWQPVDLDGIPGIVARAIDIGTVEITNGSGRTFYFGIARWYGDASCLGALASQSDGGSIAAGATVRAALPDFVDRRDVPITISFWDMPCGDGCLRAPVGSMSVPRSPIKPGAT